MRNSAFLYSRLEEISSGHFPEVDLSKINIQYGRRARTRLGSIRQIPGSDISLITINGIFMDPVIPLEIIDATIAHELCHYVHGFSSALPQLLDHPHRGGVVNKEIRARGLGQILDFQINWLKLSWPGIVKEHFPNRVKRRRRFRFSFFR